MRAFTVILVIVSLSLAAAPAAAQSDPTPSPVLALPPIYAIGDTATLPAPDDGTLTAELAGLSDPGAVLSGVGVAVWIADGVEARLRAAPLADQIAVVLYRLRQRDLYRAPAFVPLFGSVINPDELIPVPDVDFDGGITVIYVADLPDEAPAMLRTDGGEFIYVSADAFADDDGPQAVAAIARTYFDLILRGENPDLTPWVANALFDRLTRTPDDLNTDLQAFLSAPATPLLTADTRAGRGGRVLLLDYLETRFGPGVLLALLATRGDGLEPLDQALTAAGALDFVSGGTAQAIDVYADFIMAAALNTRFGDNRYMLASLSAQGGRGPRLTAEPVAGLPFSSTVELEPYASAVYQFTPAAAAAIEAAFSADDGWLVQYFMTGTSAEPPRVRRWVTADALTLRVAPRETVIFVITRAADAAGSFTLDLNAD